MKYRKLGSTGIDVSVLGFGTMRLPMQGKDVDEKAAISMIDYALDQGVNYLDTAFPYHAGVSEKIVGKALAHGKREQVYLTTKAPLWDINSKADFHNILNKQLKRLQTDAIDFYLLHGINYTYWHNVVLKYDLIAEAEKAQQAGKIRHIGFSLHDNVHLFKEVVDAYDKWSICLIQLNYLDTVLQAGVEGLRYAYDKGIGTTIMEPVKGGALIKLPPRARDVFANSNRAYVEWALDYLWDMPEVSCVVSGMSSLAQMQENIALADAAQAGMLSEQDHDLIKQAAAAFASYHSVPCTGCAYCLPCPEGVGIPYNFAVYNDYQTDGNFPRAKRRYHNWVENFAEKAELCTGCRVCEKLCPQQIPISEWMPKIAKEFK